MKKLLQILFLTALLLGLPLIGVVLSGQNAGDYLEFPPRTRHVEHAPFSWPAFIALTIAIAAAVFPFLWQIWKNRNTVQAEKPIAKFPWWGTTGIIIGIVFWILAWTRLDGFALLQRYTFTPQWIAYILVINAATFRRSGRSLLTHRTRYFLSLFPLSAAFWWFFEYLNRFVQNWHYTAVNDFTGPQYFIAATLPFATVLPAVLSTEEWLSTHPGITAGLENFLPIRIKRPRFAAVATLIIAGTGLLFIGLFPNQLFPLLWVAPLLLLISFQCLEKQPSFFPELGNGDWRRLFRLCLAALICGFFWELWNWLSLAKWIYTVPYVDRFHLFEMPILGYSGYLPFGLECAVVAELFLGRQKTD